MRIVRAVVNILLYLTMPVWVGTAVLGNIIYTAAWKKNKHLMGTIKNELTGKIWIWQNDR